MAGHIRGRPIDLYLFYPQGNPRATEDAPFLQIGESKYGRPILDWGVRYASSSLEDAARYALISLDSTMRSNVAVGPPLDLMVYGRDELRITRQRRFIDKDPDLLAIQIQWEQSLRRAVQELPGSDSMSPVRDHDRTGRATGSTPRNRGLRRAISMSAIRTPPPARIIVRAVVERRYQPRRSRRMSAVSRPS